MMKKTVLVLLVVGCVLSTTAQQRLVTEVKKEISGMSLTVDNYKNSLRKITKALENEETKDKAEPWWVAGKIQYSIYDKMMNNKALGEKVSSTDAGIALLDGYQKFQTALFKDTIIVRDKKGNPVIDKKTGRPKVKTKFSQDIANRIIDHLVDYSAVAGDFYLASDWTNAYEAWDIYCNLAKSDWAKKRKKAEPDSVVAYNRFFQGLAAYQGKNYDKAIVQLNNARSLGYKKKALYDTWIDALIKQRDTIYLVSVAHEAHDMLGANDPRYVHILINHYLKSKNYDEANVLLDEVLMSDSTVADYYDLKGRLVEIERGIDDAIPYYRKAVELNANHAMGLFDLGNALYNKAIDINDHRSVEAKKLYAEALPFLEKAYKLMPMNESLKNILSRIYYVLGSSKVDSL
jgi:tetratricopeptide (TPR) repeat protein